MPISDKLLWLCSAQVLGNAGDEYTDDTVNFGVTTPAVNKGGQFGLNVLVTTTHATMDSGVYIWIIHGAATAPTTKHSAMFIPVASMTAGAWFFVPCGSVALLQYARALFNPVSENPTAGACSMWFGPPSPPGQD